MDSPTFETVFALAILGVTVHRSLCGMDAQNGASGWRPGASEDEVGKELSADCSVSKISFSRKFFFFGFALLQVQL